MSPSIITVGKDASIWLFFRQKVFEPVDAVLCCPGPITMSVEAMNRNNASKIVSLTTEVID